MKIRSAVRHGCWWCWLLGFIMAGNFSSLGAGTNHGPQILFLHLKLTADEKVTLVNALTRPGTLKPPPRHDHPHGLHYELQDAAGKPLWTGILADPRRPVLEHSTGDRRGQLAQRTAELPAAEFMLRVPVRAEAERVVFFRFASPATNSPPEKIRLGELPLPCK